MKYGLASSLRAFISLVALSMGAMLPAGQCAAAPLAAEMPQVAAAAAPQAAGAAIAPHADKSPFEGLWIGTTTSPRQLDVVLAVRADGAAPGGLVAQATVPAFGSMSDAVGGLELKDGHLKGAITPMVGSIAFDLVAVDGALEGKLLATAPGTPQPIEMPIRMARTLFAKQTDGARTWSGVLAAPGGSLPMAITIAPDGPERWAGCIDIPLQKVEALPLFVTRAAPEAGGAYSIKLPVGLPAYLELKDESGSLVGRFRQGTFDAPIEFKPGIAAITGPPPKPAPRAQDPKAPFPYAEREVKITHPAGHVLAGTLLVPEGASAQKRVPAVVLVTGSGPQDRDEALMGHRPFAVLADALARAGIMVLRCDDRGVGSSTGSFATATTRDFATDAIAELTWLATVPEADDHRLGVIGHSEGGLIAPIVAAEMAAKGGPAPAYIVLMAGPGVSGAQVLSEQSVKMSLASGMTPAQVEPARIAHAAFMDAVMTNADEAKQVQAAKELILAQYKAAGADTANLKPEALDQQAKAVVKQMAAPWMRQFLTLDPRDALLKLRIPVMVLNGSLDAQVPVEQNIPVIEAALKEAGAPATVKVYPGLNHLFQPAKTGALDEYATIETTIDPQVLADIAAWVGQAPARK